MKRVDKKAQAAVEYLQTYAWAILLVVILGVALWQLGVFNVSPKVNVAEGFKKIKVLPESIRYVEDENCKTTWNLLNFTVMNTGGTYIHDLSFTPSEDCTPTHPNPYGNDCFEGTQFAKDTLAPGETTSLAKSCCTFWNEGDFFYVEVEITYTQRVGERKITKTEKGVIKGRVEKGHVNAPEEACG